MRVEEGVGVAVRGARVAGTGDMQLAERETYWNNKVKYTLQSDRHGICNPLWVAAV